MALIKNDLTYGYGFNITASGPVDSRTRVEFISDLTTVWGPDAPAYKDMVVACMQDHNIYILTADDATKKENWKLIGGDTAADLAKVKEDVAANKSAIDKINGDKSTTGSFAKGDADTLAAAKEYTDTAKTALIGDAATADTIKHAEKLATDASTKVDTAIAGLDGGGTSPAVKGVTVTVNETDGIIATPVVAIADGTLTGAATDGNLVTGTVVKKYVDDKVSDINASAATLGNRVTTLEGKHAEGKTVAEEVTTGIAGIAETSKANTAGSDDVVVTVTTKSGSVSSVAVDSSVLKNAVTDGDDKVKKDLLGDAATDYNTLGKLEDKIQEEVSTARAAEEANATAITNEISRAKAAEEANATAITNEISRATAEEKKNADAAAAAKTAADNAQAAADAKVASVTAKDGETAIEVDNTTATTPKISLKLDNDGNVQFVQTAKGLKGSVEIPEATVTGVKADDKFLSLADKLVSADVSIAYDAADKKIYLYGKDKNKANAVSSIDCRDFIKDGMLTDAELVTNPEGQDAGTYIKLTWNTDGGKQPMYINVTSLIDIYTAKPNGGLVLEDHAFSVDTTKIATVESVNGVTSRVSTLEGKVATIEGEGEGSIKKAVADEASRAKAAEKANADAIAAETTRATNAEVALLGTDGDDATKNTIHGAKQAVEDLKAQIEKDAVTLTIPENDPYITASKDATTNRYTISSKKDGTTPLVDVKIDAKLTDKINSLDGGGTSTVANGISVTVTETDGIVAPPTVTVTPGSVAAGNASVVTGGAVYTAINDALVWHDIA